MLSEEQYSYDIYNIFLLPMLNVKIYTLFFNNLSKFTKYVTKFT